MDFGMGVVPSNPIGIEEKYEEKIDLEQDAEMRQFSTQIVEELFDEGDDVTTPLANIPKH